MKIESEECKTALRNYKTSNLEEELVIELLLISEEDDEGFAKMTYKICDSECDIDELEKIVKEIRDELRIDD